MSMKMKLTPALRKWLVDNAGVAEDATDEEFASAAKEAMEAGKLSSEQYAKLIGEEEEEEGKSANQFAEKLDRIGNSLESLTKLLIDRETKAGDPPKKEEKTVEPPKEKAATTAKHPTDLAKMVARYGGTPIEPGEDKAVEVRVKEAAERYDTITKAMAYPSHNKAGRPHPLAGRQVKDFSDGRLMNEPSQRDKAVAGAFAKLLCATARRGGSKTFGFQALPQHDKELLYYAMEHMDWAGASDGGDFADILGRKLTSREKQALIDDSTSGGFEAAPIVFDDQIIETPLLFGELFPLVNTMPLDRGRRVEGVATGTVTGSWGGVDDSAISLFDTTSYVSAFDTTIYRWEGAIRIGLDFLSDTPIDFGQHVTRQYGERLLEDLDDVIATGDGALQPEGIAVKAGTIGVNFGGVTTLGNYESLRFGVTKAEHRPNVAGSAVFCGTEVSYLRARAIPVGAADARRLGGMDYGSYQWMEHPYKINQSLSNQQVFYAIMSRYRMYRRKGMTMRTSTEGDTLIRRNEVLMVGMARYGGQLERGACAAVAADAPA